MPDSGLPVAERGWIRPGTIAEAVGLKARLPGAVYGAGLTALQLNWPAAPGGSRPETRVIDIAGLDFGLAVSVTTPGWLRLAANAPLEGLRRDARVRAFPALATCLDGIAATGVRALATLGGNLCTPAGDARTLCAAFETRLVTASGTVGFDPARLPHDLLIAVEIAPAPGVFDKVGHRAAFSPARALLALARRDDGTVLATRTAGAEIAVTRLGPEPADMMDRLAPRTGDEEATILRALLRARIEEGAA